VLGSSPPRTDLPLFLPGPHVLFLPPHSSHSRAVSIPLFPGRRRKKELSFFDTGQTWTEGSHLLLCSDLAFVFSPPLPEIFSPPRDDTGWWGKPNQKGHKDRTLSSLPLSEAVSCSLFSSATVSFGLVNEPLSFERLDQFPLRRFTSIGNPLSRCLYLLPSPPFFSLLFSPPHIFVFSPILFSSGIQQRISLYQRK